MLWVIYFFGVFLVKMRFKQKRQSKSKMMLMIKNKRNYYLKWKFWETSDRIPIFLGSFFFLQILGCQINYCFLSFCREGKPKLLRLLLPGFGLSKNCNFQNSKPNLSQEKVKNEMKMAAAVFLQFSEFLKASLV